MNAPPLFELRLEGPAKNALGAEMIARIEGALREAAGRPLLLLGSGEAFSAGLNLREVAGFDAASGASFLERLEGLMTSLYQYPGPSVACVKGHAIAGGCILAMCCDWRVAQEGSTAKIGLNEVALGLRFPPRILEICRRRLYRHREEVLLGARLYSPSDALAVGLVDELSDKAEEVARERLSALAAHPAKAYAETKGDLRGRAPSDLVPEAAWRQAMRDLLPTWTDPALRERVAAVLGARR